MTHINLDSGSEWSEEGKRLNKTSKERKRKATAEMNDQVCKFSCLEPSCIMTFDSLQDAEDHMDVGHHKMTPEKENVYDTIRRQWAAKATSVKGTAQKGGYNSKLVDSSGKDQVLQG